MYENHLLATRSLESYVDRYIAGKHIFVSDANPTRTVPNSDTNFLIEKKVQSKFHLCTMHRLVHIRRVTTASDIKPSPTQEHQQIMLRPTVKKLTTIGSWFT
jgi:hypothetical protein